MKSHQPIVRALHPNGTRVLTVTRQGESVFLSFHLGLAEGIVVLSRREWESEFSPLAEDDPSPVADDRPKLDPARPETRFYRAILRYDGGNTCQLSEEVRFTLP